MGAAPWPARCTQCGSQRQSRCHCQGAPGGPATEGHAASAWPRSRQPARWKARPAGRAAWAAPSMAGASESPRRPRWALSAAQAQRGERGRPCGGASHRSSHSARPRAPGGASTRRGPRPRPGPGPPAGPGPGPAATDLAKPAAAGSAEPVRGRSTAVNLRHIGKPFLTRSPRDPKSTRSLDGARAHFHWPAH